MYVFKTGRVVLRSPGLKMGRVVGIKVSRAKMTLGQSDPELNWQTILVHEKKKTSKGMLLNSYCFSDFFYLFPLICINKKGK